MTSLVVVCLLFYAICGPLAHGDNMLGPGKWNLIYVRQCSDKKYILDCDIQLHKINRTHSGFNVNLKLDRTIDDTFAVRIDVCKRVDGGCKPFQNLADHNITSFVEKYGKENVIRFLKLAEVDPPYFPVSVPEIKVENFIFDFDELPIKSIYGDYLAKAYVLKNFAEVACIIIAAEFTEKHDDDDEDYEEE